jgi:hypothetical protein
MLEAILIMCIVYACQLMPLRGKTFYQLTPKQQQRVDKNFRTYMATKKGKLTPNMRIEEYLPILQKQAVTYLIMAIAMLPVYILAVFVVYLNMFF